MRSYFAAILLILSGTGYGQVNAVLFKKEEKIIKRGDYVYAEKKSVQKTSAYIRACKKIGDYYYTNNQFEKALEYYLLVSDINLDGHGVVELGMLRQHSLVNYKEVIQRIADMYLSEVVPTPPEKGTAMRYYNIRPSPFSEKEKENFSMKIFDEIFYCRKIDSLSNDSIAAFMLNPLFYTHKFIPAEIISAAKKADIKISNDSTLQANILFYPLQTNEFEMATIHRFSDMLIESTSLNSQRWQLDEFGSFPVEYKKGICYLLQLTTSKITGK